MLHLFLVALVTHRSEGIRKWNGLRTISENARVCHQNSWTEIHHCGCGWLASWSWWVYHHWRTLQVMMTIHVSLLTAFSGSLQKESWGCTARLWELTSRTAWSTGKRFPRIYSKSLRNGWSGWIQFSKLKAFSRKLRRNCPTWQTYLEKFSSVFLTTSHSTNNCSRRGSSCIKGFVTCRKLMFSGLLIATHWEQWSSAGRRWVVHEDAVSQKRDWEWSCADDVWRWKWMPEEYSWMGLSRSRILHTSSSAVACNRNTKMKQEKKQTKSKNRKTSKQANKTNPESN